MSDGVAMLAMGALMGALNGILLGTLGLLITKNPVKAIVAMLCLATIERILLK